MSGWDVLLGGGVTLAGTVITQWAAVHLAKGDRKDARRVASEQYDRVALEAVQDAVKAYRTSLASYNSELSETGATRSDTEGGLQRARMDYQALVHRVPPDVVAKLTTWETSATAWSQGEGGASAEAGHWNDAMRACGNAVRETFSR